MFQFDGFADFISMGGHGVYVWISYGITFLVMVWLLIAPIARKRQILQILQREAARQRRAGKSADKAQEGNA